MTVLDGFVGPSVVMPGLVPGIHAFLANQTKTWMAGTGPAMTREGTVGRRAA
jgi:hypothetical protein